MTELGDGKARRVKASSAIKLEEGCGCSLPRSQHGKQILRGAVSSPSVSEVMRARGAGWRKESVHFSSLWGYMYLPGFTIMNLPEAMSVG